MREKIIEVGHTKPTNGTGQKTCRVTPKRRADLDGFTHEEDTW